MITRAAAIDQNASAIEVSELEFTYRPRRGATATPALRGIDLRVAAGQSVGLLGPNGSGKSTLLKLLCGLMPLQRGEIRIFGRAINQQVRSLLGVVFQSPSLDRRMTAIENLRDHAMLFGMSARAACAAADDAMKRAGLADRQDSLVKSLSGGQIRRVDLARSLLHLPKALLLDEPTAGLDPTARSQFLEELERHQRERNLSILISTHLIDEAERFDRVMLMHEGRIIADDTPLRLRQRAGVRRIVVLDMDWSPPPSEAEQWRRTSSGWARQFDQNQNEANHVAARLALADVSFSIAPPTLADVYEHLTGVALSPSDAGIGTPGFEHEVHSK